MRVGFFALIALLGLSACTQERARPDDDDCRCAGDVPEGLLDVACGETQCVGGAGYRCTGPNAATAAPEACLGDSGAALVDAGVATADAGGDGLDAGGRDAGRDWPDPDAGTPTDSGIHAPAGWTCDARYSVDEVCDCGCGALDPACDTPLHVSVCERDACRWGDDPDPADPTECSADSPVGDWDCDLTLLADGSSCDCGCGAIDPDCGAAPTEASCDAIHCTGSRVLAEGDIGRCVEMCGEAPADAGSATCTNGGEFSIGGSCAMSLYRCDDFHRYEVECAGGECECKIDGLCVSRVSGTCGFSVSGTMRSVCGWSLVDDR